MDSGENSEKSKITKRDPMGTEHWIAYKVGFIAGLTAGFITGFLVCAYWRT
jgi:ABC-type uncharacterized transport system permease subunit